MNTDDYNILFHIGYPKAASSFLQTTLFSGSHPHIRPIPSRTVDANHAYAKPGADLLFDNIPEYRPSYYPLFFCPDDTRETILNFIGASNSDRSGFAYVMSNEGWAGHPFSGGVNALEIAQRICSVVPNARILIVVREQRNMLLSSYAHYLSKSHGLASLTKYLEADLSTQIPGHHPGYYCFSYLISKYRELFGEDNVLVMPLEELQRDQPSFTARICEFIDVPVLDLTHVPSENRRDYAEYCAVRMFLYLNILGRSTPANGFIGLKKLRLRNVVVRGLSKLISDRHTRRIIDKDIKVIEATIGHLIRKDNETLQTYVSYDLKSLGYLLG